MTIAPDFDCSVHTMQRNLKEAGIPLRGFRPLTDLTDAQLQEALGLYQDQKTLEEIAQYFNCKRQVIARKLRSAGALIRRGGKVQKYFTINGRKTCGVCKEEKACTEFGLHSTTYDGLQGSCLVCSNKANKTHELQRKFGLTQADYDLMLDSQGGVCAICNQPETRMKFGKPTQLAVDHNHENGQVRSLLCAKCNMGLGQFNDNPVTLRKAAFYLENHGIMNSVTNQEATTSEF